MNNIKSIGILLGLFILAGCGVSKMTYKLPLTDANKADVYETSTFSQTFGQLDVQNQTDTPYHLYLQSGYYYTNHLSLSVTAREGKKDSTFCVSVRASHGKKFVHNVSKQTRKAFLLELKADLFPDYVK